ncbi:MAG TPA: ATP-binding protein [Nitrospirota bacterium]|nr:ATP-binding protein [Nitrospirota bacterium]
MNPYAIPPLITSVLIFLLGLFVLLKNRTSRTNVLFFLEKFVISVWLFSDYRMFIARTPDDAYFWCKLSYVAIIFIPVFYFHFTQAFLGIQRFRNILLTVYVLGIVFEVLLFSTNYFISGVTKHYWGYYAKVGLLHSVFLAYLALLVAFSLWLLYAGVRDRTRSPEERNKIKLVLLAYLVAYQAWMDFLPKYGIELYPIGSILVGSWVLMVTYAIVRHRLFDIQVVISQGTTYSLTVILGLLPVAGIVYFLQEVFPLTVPIALVFALAVLLSFVFHNIYPYAERFVQKRLFKSRLDYYHVLRNFTNDMVAALDLQQLLQRFDQTLRDTLQVSSVAVYLTGPLNGKYPLIHISDQMNFIPGRIQKSLGLSDHRESVEVPTTDLSGLIPQWTSGDALVETAYKAKDVLVLGEMEMLARERKNETLEQAILQMRETKSEVCIPLKRDGRMIGIALLGPRENNKYYTPGDLELLHSIGQNACVAIQNALLVEDMKRSFQLLHRTQRFAAIGELVAGMSHEIRNPLMPITYLLELAGNPTIDRERIKRQTETSWLALRRITGVLNEIEMLAAPYRPELKPVDIEMLLDDVITVLEPQIKEKAQKVIRQYAALPEPLVDSDRLSQAFLDVLLNAIEANPEGGSIWVRTREIVLRGDLMGLQVEIEDCGNGIAPENIERVFDPFFTTKYKSIMRGGTGLGLSLAQRIMQDHRGTIELVSTEGKGTRVLMNLPMRGAND